MPSISAMSAIAASVGVPPTAADGCSAAASSSDGGVVVADAGDVGGQVHDVGQVQHERRLGHVHRRAVRRQRVGDRAHGVLVLLEVLRRAGQRGGQRQVVGVVAGAADGAGQHPGGDQAALAAHQQLRGGAEQAVDVEGPAGAGSSSASRRSGHRTSIASARRRRPGRGPARPSRGRRRRCGGPPRRPPGSHVGAAQGAVGEGHVARRLGRRRRVELGRGADRADRRRGSASVTPSRRPTTTSGTTQHAVAGVVGEGEGAERDQPGAGQVDLVAHDRAAGLLAPPRAGPSAKRSAPGGAAARRRRPSRPGRRRGAPRRWSEAGSVAGGRRSSSGPGSSSGTVRTTSGSASRGGRRDWSSRSMSLRPAGAAGSGSGPRDAAPVPSPTPRVARVTRADLDKNPADVAAMFDDVAKRYDLTNDVLSLGQDRRWRTRGAATRSTRGRASGCSTSPPAPAPRAQPFAEAGALRRARATSRSGMLAVGKQAAPDLPFVAGDGTRLPFADDTFDAVTISFGLRNIVDPRRRPARDAAGDPAGRPAGGVRVQLTRPGRRSGPSTSSTS